MQKKDMDQYSISSDTGRLCGMLRLKFAGYHKCYCSRQISKMYAVHIGVYWTIAGFAAFYEFSVRDCLILSVVVLIVTDLLVQGYIIIDNKIKEQK